ncbi:MAG: MFS transporter [Pseudomonadota bacterium]
MNGWPFNLEKTAQKKIMQPDPMDNNSINNSRFEKKWHIFLLVAVSIFMSTLDSSIVNVALPYMMQDLKTDIQTIQWVVLIYLTTVSSLLLTFGRLSDIKGRKSIYILGFTVFVAGSFFCGMAKAPWVLILSRAFQGGGAAMLMACSPAMIVDAFPVQERGKALGMIGAVVAAGLTIGPVAGGFLLDYFSWQYIFYINIPIGIAASLGAMMILTKNQVKQQIQEPIDKTGSFLLIMILSSLILFLTQVSDQGLFSVFSLGASGVFVVATTAFVVIETRMDFPLFDFNLLKIKLFVFPVIASAILFAALFMIVFLMPFYLTYPCGFSASGTGSIMVVPFLFLLVVSPISGMMYDRWGSRRLCMVGMGSIAASLMALTTLSPSMGVISILWRMALAGIGTALFVSPNNTAILSSVPFPQRGIASGTAALARNLGMVVGVALAGLVFTSSFLALTHGTTLEQYVHQMEPFFMTSFKRTMVTGSVLAVIGVFITFARGKET